MKIKTHNTRDINKINIPRFITTNEPLKDKNWFGTGGLARFYCEPKTSLEFQQALDFAKNFNLENFVLGQGANILIHDNGFNGLVIRPKLDAITHMDIDENYGLITAESGVVFENLINYCLDNDLLGLEEFSGIPGTVGGSVFINIHYFNFLLSHFLVNAKVINQNTGEIKLVDQSWFNFGYNTSTLHSKEYYLVNATFKLKKVTPLESAYAKGRSHEIIRHRTQRYPTKGTCGSFFRNFYDHEVTLISNNRKLIWVAYYLDKIGVKGQLTVNNAIVSYQHANMIVNTGGATTQDIIDLTLTMQKLVFDKFGIKPQPECQLIGFDKNPY